MEQLTGHYLAETPEDLMTGEQRWRAEWQAKTEIALERDVAAIKAMVTEMYSDYGSRIDGGLFDDMDDALGNLENAIRKTW